MTICGGFSVRQQTATVLSSVQSLNRRKKAFLRRGAIRVVHVESPSSRFRMRRASIARHGGSHSKLQTLTWRTLRRIRLLEPSHPGSEQQACNSLRASGSPPDGLKLKLFKREHTSLLKKQEALGHSRNENLCPVCWKRMKAGLL